jgi:hypothetical protein
MRILCAYTPKKMQMETFGALVKYGAANSVRVDFVDVSGSRTAYWHAIRERWNGEEDLVTVEQDNVITDLTIPSFLRCDRDWCSYKYYGPEWLPEHMQEMTRCLGCTRFSAALQRKIPSETIAGDYMVWYLIDERLSRLLGMHGFRVHGHGEVKHLHDYANDATEAEKAQAKAIFAEIDDRSWDFLHEEH